MNRIFLEPGETGSGPHDLLFDWRPELERLEQAATLARIDKIPDPWVLVEAECWLDLIDAELLALKHLPPEPRATQSRRQLEDWRLRVQATIDALRQAETPNQDSGDPSDNRRTSSRALPMARRLTEPAMG